MATDDNRTRAAIRPVKQQVEDELLARPGVSGVDIGEKYTGGHPTGRLSIIVFVEEKKPLDHMAEGEAIPPEINGIPTDVVEMRIVPMAVAVPVDDAVLQVDTGTYTPLKGGISMGPCRSIFLSPPDVPTAGNYTFVGTLGAMVRDRSTNAMMGLTNFHVACVDDGWTAGDTMTQPGRPDGGSCPSGNFGTLTRAVLSEHVDGAVVTINSTKSTDCSIVDIGAVKGQATAAVNMTVRKRGRTTGLTHGTVGSTDASVSINYGDGLGVRVLKNQVRVNVDSAQSSKFSDHGDSGSVVVTSDNKVIGLLFAGNDVPSNPALSGTISFVNPIQSVLDELDVNLCVQPSLVLTAPSVCSHPVTKPVFCDLKTTTVACSIVTRPALCQVLTTPSVCAVVRTTACPVVTAVCPPRTLACGPRLPDGRVVNPVRPGGDVGAADEGQLADLYGTPGGDEAEDAFWLGYYTALEAVAEAEEAAGEEG